MEPNIIKLPTRLNIKFQDISKDNVLAKMAQETQTMAPSYEQNKAKIGEIHGTVNLGFKRPVHEGYRDSSDVDMFTQFSEAEGEGEGGKGWGGGEGWGDGSGWLDPDEARGRQMSQPLFFHTPPPHTHTAPAAASQETAQWWRR